MPTLYSKVYAYSKSNNFPLLNENDLIKLGTIVIEKYFQCGIKKHINYVISKQYNGEYKVINYPKEFTPVMNDLIKSYYTTITSSKIKRKRIKRFEKVYSVKKS